MVMHFYFVPTELLKIKRKKNLVMLLGKTTLVLFCKNLSGHFRFTYISALPLFSGYDRWPSSLGTKPIITALLLHNLK